MSPIGLLIILLISFINFISAKSSLNFTHYASGRELLQVYNGLPGFPDNTTCPPGEYEGNEGDCLECLDYEDRCYDSKVCCGMDYMFCDMNIQRCKCEYPYKYSYELFKCIETAPNAVAYIIIGSIFVIPFTCCVLIYLCRKKVLNTRFFEKIREGREARCAPVLLNTIPNAEASDIQEPIRPDGYNGLSDIVSRQYNTKQDCPAGLSEALARQQVTDSTQNMKSRPIGFHLQPQPDSNLKNPNTNLQDSRYIHPEVYARDIPSGYNEITSILNSPPPVYNHAIGFQIPKEEKY